MANSGSHDHSRCNATLAKVTVMEWTLSDLNPVNWTISYAATLASDGA
jgi:hypothetical protein